MANPTTLTTTRMTLANFRPADDQWITQTLPFKASTAQVGGSGVRPETSGADVTGYYTLALTENAGGDDLIGILTFPITSTDADYAAPFRDVFIPRTTTAKAFFTVTAGTFTVADVGKTVELGSGSIGLAVDTVGKGATITDYISSTRGKCMFNLPHTETA